MKDCPECTSGDRQVFIIIITWPAPCYWSLSFHSKTVKKKKNHGSDVTAYSNNNNSERFQIKLDQGQRDLP